MTWVPFKCTFYNWSMWRGSGLYLPCKLCQHTINGVDCSTSCTKGKIRIRVKRTGFPAPLEQGAPLFCTGFPAADFSLILLFTSTILPHSVLWGISTYNFYLLGPPEHMCFRIPRFWTSKLSFPSFSGLHYHKYGVCILSFLLSFECVMLQTSALMMPTAGHIEITVVKWSARCGWQGWRCWWSLAVYRATGLRWLGCLLCKHFSTWSMGQQNISGRVYFNKPNSTISIIRNVRFNDYP